MKLTSLPTISVSKVYAFSIITASLLVFSGCQAINKADSMTKTDSASVEKIHINNTKAVLTEYDWQLKSVVDANNQPVPMMTSYTSVSEPAKLRFAQSGNTMNIGFDIGCNKFGGEVQINNDMMTVGMLRSTRMYCAELDNLEQTFAGLMGGTSKMAIYPTNPTQLVQLTETGEKLTWIGKARK